MKKLLAFLALSCSARLVLGAPSLKEGFEGTTFPPAGWTTKTAGLPVPHAWHRTTDPDYRGTGRASAFVGSVSPSAIDEWLITPAVTLGATDKAIKFSWSGSPHWSSVLDASLNIQEVGATIWTRLWSIAGNESPADPFVYRERIVDLSAWTGKRVKFGFRVAGTKGASFGLDDVAVGDLAPNGEYLLPEDTTCAAAPGRGSPSPWRVVAVREPWADDVPFEIRTGYLWPSGDANYVPGPDSLVARVAIIERRGYVELLDLRTGTAQRLLKASLPQWSPDGRLISCVTWKSTRQPYVLTVVEVATGRIVLVDDLAQATSSKWSPDSRTIVGSGIAYQWKGAFLYTVTVPDGRVTVIDSLNVLGTHEFSWSPDGHWIAFSRPTRLHHYGDTTASDLWIADAATGESWCILDAPEWAESDPLWITNRSIQITRIRWSHDEYDRGEPLEEQRLVVELSHAGDAHHQE